MNGYVWFCELENLYTYVKLYAEGMIYKLI